MAAASSSRRSWQIRTIVPLIIRNIYIGITRFDRLQQSLGISRKVLAEWLRWLTGNGVLVRREYSSRPPRHEYALTAKGLELFEILMVMVAWGDKWLAGAAGPPALYATMPAARSATSNWSAPNAAGPWRPPTSTCSPVQARPCRPAPPASERC
jgi:DNA-binding HxlR family transcriptional regulator